MEWAIALALRGGLGILFGVLMGIMGFLGVWWLVPGFFTPPMWLLVNTAGLAASIAGFLAWYKPEATRRVSLVGLALALAGGIAGAWLGYWYGTVAYPGGVRNVLLVATTLRSPAVMPFITGAALFSTFFGSIYYAFRLWRYHEV